MKDAEMQATDGGVIDSSLFCYHLLNHRLESIAMFSSSSGLMVFLYFGAAVLIVLMAAGILHISTSILERRLRTNGKSILYARILSTVRGPATLMVATFGLLPALLLLRGTDEDIPALRLFSEYESLAVRIWLAIIACEISWFASRFLQALIRWYVRSISQGTATDLNRKLLPHVRRFTPIVVFSIGILTALNLLGIAITPLLAGLGIGGIAVALALQPTLSNLFSGTYLITEGELNEGDFIELDNGPSGFVVEVGWRSTKIRDRNNNLIMIPNSKMIESIMTNYYSQTTVVTLFVNCGVSYQSDLQHVERIALEVLNEVKDDLEEAEDDFEPVIRFTTFGESNIDFVLVIQARDRLDSFVVKHELIKRLHVRFGQEDIEINYPVRKLLNE